MNPHMPGPVRHAMPPAQAPLPFIAPRPPMMPDMPPGDPSHYLQHQMHHQQLAQHGLPLLSEQIYDQGQPLHPHQIPLVPPDQAPPPIDLSAFPRAWPQTQAIQSSISSDAFNQQNLVSPVHFGILPTTHEGAVGHPPVDLAQYTSGDAPLSNTSPVFQQYIQQPATNAEGPSAASDLNGEDAYWYPDDEASLVASEDDDEEDFDYDDEAQHLESNDLGVIVAKRLQNRPVDIFGTQMRTFANFADANVLATYIPNSVNSPLNDAQTASVFWYFVNVTGPSMSLFERRPFDPSPIFQGRPVPRSRQHIWTCELCLSFSIFFWTRGGGGGEETIA